MQMTTASRLKSMACFIMRDYREPISQSLFVELVTTENESLWTGGKGSKLFAVGTMKDCFAPAYLKEREPLFDLWVERGVQVHVLIDFMKHGRWFLVPWSILKQADILFVDKENSIDISTYERSYKNFSLIESERLIRC